VDGVHQAGGGAGLQVELDVDGAPDRGPQHVAELHDEVVEVRGLGLQPRLAREGQELLRELGAPLRRAARGLEEAARPLLVLVGLEQVEVAGDHLEQVVEVVGEAGGELADRLHLLRLPEGLLGGAPARHVEL
jgi:hypothetical protein